MGIAVCLYCKTQFKRPDCHLKRAKRNFCSRECIARYKNPDPNIMVGKTGVLLKVYSQVHYWLNKQHGAASRCEHCNIQDGKFEWALKKGCEYLKNIDNFLQLCQSCHRKYDFNPDVAKRMKLTMSNKRLAAKPIVGENENGAIVLFPSVAEAANALNINSTGVTHVLKGRQKTAGGYKWKYQNF